MPSIINNTFFIGDLEIPNAIPQPSIGLNTPNETEQLNDCITYTERDILLKAFGLTLYNELQSQLPITPASDQKWIDLVNGKEYDGKVWEGLSNPKSLLAYAVYFQFLTQQSDYWAVTGIVRAESANATNKTPLYKLATAQQTFIAKYQKGYIHCPYIARGLNWEFIDWHGGRDKVEVSLYEFIKDYSEVYGWTPDKFKHYETVNSFGL